MERKFLVDPGRLPDLRAGARLRQGYLGTRPTVRVRTEEQPTGDRHAYLTIKSEGLVGRDEFEYPIPFDEAEALLELSQGSVIDKTRHCYPVARRPDLAWEIDVFEGENAGLVVAEIELPREDEPFERPDWLGEEVTEDPRYKNAALAFHPYRSW
ncbi:MAG TPA: CYTH domain-containing protein [Armatimonadota bacterium]|nr:CYTH domain-containing protein [Armatimonadota bacterium]